MPIEASFQLPDGRRLAWAEFGAADGRPVLYCHGSPSSRLEPALIGEDAIARAGLRLIAADRPGIGGSDPQPGRRITDWPRDALALADHHGLARFALLGNSGGGPYVVACAAAFPERITAAAIVSGGWDMTLPEATAGLPLVNRIVLKLARYAPLLLRPLYAGMLAAAGGSEADQLAQMKSRVPAADFAAFSKPGRVDALNAAIREAMRDGTRGAVEDMQLYVRGFDLDPGAVRVPIRMFHGVKDANAPIALARLLAARLPAATLTEHPDDAHLSVLTERFDDVARALRSG